MIVSAYVVLGRNANGVIKVRRTAQRRPGLDYDEALVKLELDVPQDVFDAPLVTLEVAKGEVAVSAEARDPLEDDREE